MLQWFASEPARYGWIAWSTFAALFLAVVVPALRDLFGRERIGRPPGWAFALLVTLSLFAARWPWLMAEREINVDESQMIAEAAALTADPIFWRAADGTTHGPLNVYPLLLTRLFGLPLDHGSARLVGTLLILAALLATHATLRRFVAEDAARLAILPAGFFFGFGVYLEFAYYTSELAPIALLAIGLWGTVHPRDGSWARHHTFAWWLGGVALGAVPWAKLQAAPIAVALWLTVAIVELRRQSPRANTGWQRVGALAMAAALPAVGFTLMTLIGGVFGYAWEAYIRHNLVYTAAGYHSFGHMVAGFWGFAGMGPGFTPFAIGFLVFAGLFGGWLALARRSLATVVAIVFLLVSFWAALAPGRLFPHYLLLLVVPATWFAGMTAGAAWPPAGRGRRKQVGLAVVLGFVGALIVPQIVARAPLDHPDLGRLPSLQAHKRSAVARAILEVAEPGERMGQWGWMPRYYVQTRLLMATRVAHTEREINPSPLREHWRTVYLADLERSAPPVFIDTVGPGSFGFADRATQGHETFPALANYIEAHYDLATDLAGTRIYRRRSNP